MSFTLTATPAPSSALTVNVKWSQTGGSFLTGSRQRTVTIPTSGMASLEADTADDGADESAGSVTVTVEAGNGYTVGTPNSATVDVTDDDTATNGGGPIPDSAAPPRQVPEVTISGSGTVQEGGKLTVTLTATPPPPTDLTVNLEWSQSRSSLLPAVRPPTAIIRPDSGTVAVEVTLPDGDTDHKLNGSVTVTVATGSGYKAGDTSVWTTTVVDNDPAPIYTVTLKADKTSVAHGGVVTLTFTATPSVVNKLTVHLDWKIENIGVTGRDATITISSSAHATHTAAPSIWGDFNSRGTMKVSIDATPPKGYMAGSPSSVSVTVLPP